MSVKTPLNPSEPKRSHYAALLQKNGVLDIAAVQRELLRLDLAVYSPLRGAVARYVRHYGIDFENTLPQVRHYVGSAEVHGYCIAAHVFLPVQAKGTLFIFHGYLDHTGLYAHVIKDALVRGYAVFMMDLPGHGLSSGERASIPDFSHYQSVLDGLLEKYAAELPAPFFALGQSTGGAILMDHVLSALAENKAPHFKKIILLAPLLRPRQWQKIKMGYWLLHFFKRSVPRVFRKNSNDKDFLAFISGHDSLQEKALSLQWAGALKRWVPHMLALPRSQFPVLLVQGSDDNTVAWRGNLDFVRAHFSVEHEVIVQGAGHHLVNETDALRAAVHEAVEKVLR